MTPTGEPRGTVTLRWSGRLSGAIETAWAILDISPRSEDRRCSTDLPRHERQTSDSADRRAEGYMPSAGNIQDHPSRLNNCVSGANVLFIEEDGAVRGGVCDKCQPMGNIFTDPEIAILQKMNIVRCTATGCNSIENIPLPKFR